MPKILVIEPVLINLGTDEGGIHHDVGDFAEVNKDTARALTEAGRVLYTEPGDDHSKVRRFTATPEMIKAASAAQ